VFYQYGLFSQEATARTASALAWFAVGLIGHIVVHVLARAFYAMQDTRTPVTWAIVAVGINVPLMIVLVDPMGVEGLALALSISAVIEVIGLLWSLNGRLEGIEGRSILGSLVRAGLAAVAAGIVMGAGLAAASAAVPDLLADPFGRLVALVVLAALGGIAFIAVAALLRSPELQQLRDALLRRRRA
jgi:putative peptidoglycan lipid II flippase